MARFFISHSSKDRELALQLRARLSSEAWVDLFEIGVGDVLLDRISAGLEQATDFVLVWSKHSADSAWVQYEFQMAVMRWLDDQAIAIRVVCIDDTPMNLQLAPFMQYRGADVEGIVDSLLSPPVRPPAPRPFVDRNEEINQLERAYYASSAAMVWVWGVPGVGKRATVREALRRFVPDQRRHRRLRVREGTSEVELVLQLMASLGEHDPRDGRPWPPMDALAHVSQLLERSIASGMVWTFEDAQHWLRDDAAPTDLLEHLLKAVEQAVSRAGAGLAVFTSTRRPDLRTKSDGPLTVVRLDGLRTEFGVALLRTHGAGEDEEVLRRASVQLAGQPLALTMVAGRVGDPQLDWSEERIRRARSIVSRARLSESTESLLEAIAIVDGPMPVEQLAGHLNLSPDDIANSISQAVSYSLLHVDDLGYLDLHPIVRDYFDDALRARPDRQTRVTDLADRARQSLITMEPGAPRYVRALISTYWLLAMSNRLAEAYSLRQDLYGTLYSAGVELYRQQRYGDALPYFEQVDLTSVQGLNAQLYLARCMAYVGRLDDARQLADRLLASEPRNPHILRVRGRVEFIAGQWREALRYFNEAYSRRPQYTVLLRDRAQCMIRLGDWGGARRSLEEAIRRGDEVSYTLNFYSEVLEHDGEYGAALEYMRRAVELEARNPVFHHRLGQIAERTGNFAEALEHFEDARRLDPAYHQAGLSVASLLVDMGDLNRAEQVLDETELLPGVRKTVAYNIRAKLHLAKAEVMDARLWVERALDAAPNEVQNLGLAARIELAAQRKGLVPADVAQERIRELAIELRALGEAAQAAEVESQLQ